jgi:hypothetical protein
VLVTRWSRESGDWEKDAMSNADEESIPMQWLLEGRELGDVRSGWTVNESEI